MIEAIFCCPLSCYLREESDFYMAMSSFQVLVESGKVSIEACFLQANIPIFFSAFSSASVAPPQFHCPSLDTLQHLNVFLELRGSGLGIGFEVWPHQGWLLGDAHCSGPGRHSIADTGQDATGLLATWADSCLMFSCCQLAAPGPFCWATLQPLFVKPVVLHGIFVIRVQDTTPGLAELAC
ncbi:hypothetical protein DUI87_31133 [Hirundo rustica rustica]|uniref:Uncharacterized protein n=1 Tax=Hirundo rustica rustica TaxID=333673 RepID=A0A3M0IX31_HIRRU|nr:hypothetical protein DUI87_31133 [Hirundo rustica rustica]